jgi:hypothetical protein
MLATAYRTVQAIEWITGKKSIPCVVHRIWHEASTHLEGHFCLVKISAFQGAASIKYNSQTLFL